MGVRRFQTFEGVFTPTLLSIFGVIMYLRLGWVVGQAGLKGALLIIIISNLITILTGLSLSSIITNMRIGDGGAYSIISKSLGLEIGGAIGIPLYFAMAISVAFYITGFSECWISIFPAHNYMYVSLVAWALLFIIAYASARFAFRLQYVVMAVIVASLVSIFIVKTNINQSVFLFSGLGTSSFWQVFAVFFPAVTGILTGVSMSGELHKPERSIPLGTLSAIGVSIVIYVLFAFWFASQASAQELVDNPLIVITLSRWKGLVIAGIMGATISSALNMFVASPRTLMALGKHRIIPMSSFFAKIDKRGEPSHAVLLTAVISLGALLLGTLNTIASLLTMVFLITYGILNVAVFIEQSIGIISFRPSFKIPVIFPLLGGISCIFAMFLINPLFSLTAIIIILFIYFILLHREIRRDWPDVRKGVFVFIAEKALKISARLPYHPKVWKPDLLIPVSDPDTWEKTVPLIRAITSPSGRVTFYNVTGDSFMKKDDTEKTKEKLSVLTDRLMQEGIFATSMVVKTDELLKASSVITQTCRGSILPPNVLFVRMGNSAAKDKMVSNIVSQTASPELGLILFKQHDDMRLEPPNSVNLWIRDCSPNVDLAVLVALQLTKNLEGNLRLLQVISRQSEYSKAQSYLSKLKKLMRMPHNTEIHIITGQFEKALKKAPEADVNIFGMTEKIEISYIRRIADLIDTSTLFLKDSKHESAVA